MITQSETVSFIPRLYKFPFFKAGRQNSNQFVPFSSAALGQTDDRYFKSALRESVFGRARLRRSSVNQDNIRQGPLLMAKAARDNLFHHADIVRFGKNPITFCG